MEQHELAKPLWHVILARVVGIASGILVCLFTFGKLMHIQDPESPAAAARRHHEQMWMVPDNTWRSRARNGPSPVLTPAEVVYLVHFGLQNHDEFFPQSGTRTFARFLSTRNELGASNFDSVDTLFRRQPYRQLVNLRYFDLLPFTVEGDWSRGTSRIVGRDGREAVYTWQLAFEPPSSTFSGGWVVRSLRCVRLGDRVVPWEGIASDKAEGSGERGLVGQDFSGE